MCSEFWSELLRYCLGEGKVVQKASETNSSETVCNLLIPANPAVDNLDEHLDVHLEIAIEVHEQAPTRQSPDCSRPAWTQAEQAADNREGR